MDRVKEAAFGSLQFRIPYARVLDLFSGSGNLGLEALSRGAAHAVLNDRSPASVSVIRKNVSTLGFGDAARVLNLDYRAAIELLSREGETFDIVFLDAPYRDGTAQLAAEELFRRGMIAPDGVVMLEFGTELDPPHGVEGLMRVQKVRRYGKCGFALLEGENES